LYLQNLADARFVVGAEHAKLTTSRQSKGSPSFGATNQEVGSAAALPDLVDDTAGG
jgi:hypothetical protein